MVSQKNMDYHENLFTLLPNRMPCHHHIEDRIDINRK
jgi:hypothetical protein